MDALKRLLAALVVIASAGVLRFLLSGHGGGCIASPTDSSACISRPGLFAVYYVAVDPLHSQTVYVASTDNPVDKSTDGGASWRGLYAWKGDYVSGPVVLDPRTPRNVYVPTSDGVYESPDGGATWVPAGLQGRCGGSAAPFAYLNACAVNALAVAPGGRILYAAVESCLAPDCLYAGPAVFKSTNGGSSWIAVGLASQDVTSLAVDPRRPATVYAAADRPVKSTDGGASWQRIGGLPADASALTIDPHHPQTVYAASDQGVFTSRDGGLRWRNLGLGGVMDVALSSKAVYAATGSRVFMRTHAGKAWRIVGDSRAAVESIAVSANGRILYAGVDENALYRFRLGR